MHAMMSRALVGKWDARVEKTEAPKSSIVGILSVSEGGSKCLDLLESGSMSKV